MSAQASETRACQGEVVTISRADNANPKPESASPQSAAEAAPRKGRGRRTLLMVAVPLVLAVVGGWFYLNGGRYEETDNAYVQQAKVALSADVAGRIIDVRISENQAVTKGDVLFTIDPQAYQIALEQAKAALLSARVNVEQLKVTYATAEATKEAAEATLELQQATFDRQKSLVDQGVSSTSTLDQPKLALQQAQNGVTTARQQVASATAALAGDPEIPTDQHPAVLAAIAQVEQAKRNLGKTTVASPADGIISQVSSLNVGQFVAAGTTIASLVETDESWVEANFKETQLGAIQIGMPVEVTVDAYADQPLEGHVASIGAATGSEFSLIPAQNATGNWVKVVQRVPVRVEFDEAEMAEVLRSGMSALVSVDTGHSTLDRLTGK
ncbi:HlyD family secretion protein [Devosia sp. PTR5]|uniref:HlyD family secretion protein n=1 Tax=Devosia oryzisoli TaxID=2774138 RepID=A0A927FWX6_9HYPH|nr:HlyD family secretion protein [Devosia oryzisoli]MBD8066328.1 HlyD family secretion protein [Devosia oryzisoli]